MLWRMQPLHDFRTAAGGFCCSVVAVAVLLFAPESRADQIEMQNGDRYNGKVLLLTNDVMVLQSEVLGTITIPRAKVARIALGKSATNSAAKARETNPSSTTSVTPATNSLTTELASLRKSGVAASDAENVKQQFLADADPAAKAKFDEMLGDLTSGKMTIGDLRVQAKSAADQLRGLKKELGPEAEPTLDGYLAVLESFLREVPAGESVTRTNISRSLTRSKTQAEKEE
jgi:hypothetical protein